MLGRRQVLVLSTVVIFIVNLAIYNYYTSSQTYHKNQPYRLNIAIESRSDCSPYRNWSTGVVIDGVRYPQLPVPPSFNYSINFDCLQKATSIKRILVWNKFFGTMKSNGSIYSLETCPLSSKCEVTHDLSMLDSSDAVFVHVADRFNTKLPMNRPMMQQWVLAAYESPMNSRNLIKYNNYFNLSSMYYASSDFPSFYMSEFYEKYEWKKNESFDLNFDYSAGKSGMAFKVMSNCHTHSHREDYFKELGKYVQVKFYGGCGETCLKDCRDQLVYKYKFYLAFENSICDEYITEKLFHYLLHPVVPIVLGGGEYEKHVPKSAYINALDFKTVKDLGDYLNYLDRNRTAYNEYFKWKQYLSIRKQGINSFAVLCDLCIHLHLQNFHGIEHKVESRIDQLYNKHKKCRSGYLTTNKNGDKIYKIK